jgi:hypothetical protein
LLAGLGTLVLLFLCYLRFWLVRYQARSFLVSKRIFDLVSRPLWFQAALNILLGFDATYRLGALCLTWPALQNRQSDLNVRCKHLGLFDVASRSRRVSGHCQ